MNQNAIPVISTPGHSNIHGNIHKSKSGANTKNLIPISLSENELDARKELLSSKKLSILAINARSVRNKCDELKDYIVNHNADICAITETWLSKGESDNMTRGSLIPDGYKLLDVPRTGRGGGVAVLFKSTLNVKQQTVTAGSFECLEIIISAGNEIIRLAVLYRPPSSSKAGVPSSVFLEEFHMYVDHHISTSGKLLITGDFNFHMDDITSQDAKKFMDLLESLNLEQHVHEPTHSHGHILDLVITRCEELPISDLNVHAPILSDHGGIMFSLPLGKPPAQRDVCVFRRLNKIDIKKLKQDIINSELYSSPCDNIDEYVSQYNTVLRKILDEHAPEVQKKVTIRHNPPWFTDEVAQLKRERRRAERKWRSTKLIVHKEIFKCLHHRCVDLCDKLKADHYVSKIDENKGNQKALFNITNSLLHRKKVGPLPSHVDSQKLADEFAEYFVGKIKKIHEAFPDREQHIHCETKVPTLGSLDPTTEEELRKVIMQCKPKSCPLDPLPTSLIKKCIDCMLPILVRLVNLSFASSSFPDAFKIAMVIPLLKKLILDEEDKTNYRPVSNLAFAGKVVEKVAVKRFSSHVNTNNLDVLLQSAYKGGHSVETALVKVYDDLLCAIDSKKYVLLTLLDLSAAFDTVDHSVMLSRLETCFGITGSALDWMKSYFKDRYQFVSINGSKSQKHLLEYGVPQGSVIGPFCFPKYSSPLAKIAEKHTVYYHLYADDTQLYIMFNAGDGANAVTRLEACISEIRQWMMNNMLKLNDKKTEFMVLGSRRTIQNVCDITSLQVGDSSIESTSVARNIGAVMDRTLDMHDHVKSICKSSYINLRNISRIRKYLTEDAAAILVHSLVISKLDNLNALLYGLPDTTLHKLQLIQNHAAKIVVRKKKLDHVTPIMISLHWLPIAYRIKYKVLLLTHKCIFGKAPGYLSSLLSLYEPGRALRSADHKLLKEKQMRLKTYGDRAFSAAAPQLWNSLPGALRKCDCEDRFKKALKTFLFKKAFDV